MRAAKCLNGSSIDIINHVFWCTYALNHCSLNVYLSHMSLYVNFHYFRGISLSSSSSSPPSPPPPPPPSSSSSSSSSLSSSSSSSSSSSPPPSSLSPSSSTPPPSSSLSSSSSSSSSPPTSLSPSSSTPQPSSSTSSSSSSPPSLWEKLRILVFDYQKHLLYWHFSCHEFPECYDQQLTKPLIIKWLAAPYYTVISMRKVTVGIFFVSILSVVLGRLPQL